MPIFQYGQLNTTALVVADVYVQIVPPQFLLNGVPSNIAGYVGTASWGPVNSPEIVGSPAEYGAKFGPPQLRNYDLGTYAMIAFQQNAAALKMVRVTDGTDAAASIEAVTGCITFTSKYTGSYGNQTKVTIGPGSKANSFLVRVQMPGVIPEVFDNVAAGLTGAAAWAAIANAINTGIPNIRSGSNLIIATADDGTTAVGNGSYQLAGGTDGVTTITASVMLGTDTLPRTGMYALRDQDVSILTLCDMTDPTTVATMDAFAQQQALYGIYAGPAGQSISDAKTAKTTAAIDSAWTKWLIGDWAYWNDSYNGVTQRLVSPAAFAAGKLAALAPQYSLLNQRVNGVVGSQKSNSGVPYTSGDLQELALAGIDVMCAPAPGGNYFAFRNGHNSSSNGSIHGDNYTRMTNYIAQTLNKGMGIYIGRLQSSHANDDTRRQAKITLDAFMTAMQQQNQIDDFKVVLDLSNNSLQRIAQGYMQADVQVRYLAVVEFFLINLQGGQSVEITRTNTVPQAVAA
jgi:hypothetical protein